MTSRKVVMRGPHEIHIVEDHTWTEHGKCAAC
jgi:hypothetical protein